MRTDDYYKVFGHENILWLMSSLDYVREVPWTLIQPEINQTILVILAYISLLRAV